MIGETVYFHDENRRKYVDDGTGRKRTDERFKFAPVVIHGETARSWLTEYSGRGYAINKKTMTITGAFGLSNRVYTASQVEDALWIGANYYEIEKRVRDCRDVAKLKAIAAILEADAEREEG